MSRYWMSWRVSEEDYRPLHDPPNAAILGWWCTGFSDTDSTLCGLVEAPDEDTARAAVEQDWPGIRWRFVEQRAEDYIPKSDRFPASGWRRERMRVKQVTIDEGVK